CDRAYRYRASFPTRRSSDLVLPAAVLFDMDGTLVDTEPYWMRAEREIVARHGATWTHDDALAAVGQALPRTGAMLRDAGVPLEPDRKSTRLNSSHVKISYAV